MKMWRQSIKESFGENGKIFFWEPKRKGMLIGNPEGTGVALMESNLGVVPVVKKNPNKCDFLLVRDGGKWVLRRIDCAYVSGQVEPKEEVFPTEIDLTKTSWKNIRWISSKSLL